jgi:ABC-2 type transport system permease protein
MTAVYKREIRGYFSSAIGYVFLAIFYFFAAIFFYSSNLANNTSDIAGLFNNLNFIIVVLIPLLTMRLICEETKQKTDQLLLTSPVSLTGVVLGKFLAALTIFCIGLSSIVIFSLTMAAYVNIDAFVILGNFLGTILLASALIGIGIFISSLTESQVISAVASFFVMLLLSIMGNFSSVVTNKFLQAIISEISISTRYNNFSMGIFNLGDTVYYFSIAALFIFLTVRILEKRRWS